jgi:hypothetical protein
MQGVPILIKRTVASSESGQKRERLMTKPITCFLKKPFGLLKKPFVELFETEKRRISRSYGAAEHYFC